jgi:hypothetical protein
MAMLYPRPSPLQLTKRRGPRQAPSANAAYPLGSYGWPVAGRAAVLSAAHFELG